MFFDTKYDEKKIDSFNQMNALLSCVLLFLSLVRRRIRLHGRATV